MTLLYWRDNGEDKFEEVTDVSAAYNRASFIVRRYGRSVWFYDPRPDEGFVRVYEHTRNRSLTEYTDLDMVPKPLQLLVSLGG